MPLIDKPSEEAITVASNWWKDKDKGIHASVFGLARRIDIYVAAVTVELREQIRKLEQKIRYLEERDIEQ